MDILVVNCQTGEETLVPMTAEQIADEQNKHLESCWKVLRRTRNDLLAACDWTVLGDSPTSTAAWKAYRQALRDLPANTTDPFNVDWPTPPS